MDKQKLTVLLEAGAITNDEFETLAGAEDAQVENAPKEQAENEEEKVQDTVSGEQTAKKAAESALLKLERENESLKIKYQTLQKEKLTDGERRQLDIEEKERAILEREVQLLERENRLYAIKAIKEAGLDDGSNMSLELIDFVLESEKADIDKKVKSFKELITRMVKKGVDDTFKQNGRSPEKGVGQFASNNPFKEGSINLTKQMEIVCKNPELAKMLQDQAKI